MRKARVVSSSMSRETGTPVQELTISAMCSSFPQMWLVLHEPLDHGPRRAFDGA
jgi:hypothetical protein